MIQRKQTLWLFFAIVAAFLTLKLPFYTGNVLEASAVKTFKVLDARFNILILIITVAIAVTAGITIFLYKDRKRQMMLTTIATILAIVNIALYYWQTKKFVDGAVSFTGIVIFIIPILLVMAINGMYKDEKLLKSVDRLR